MLSRIFPKQFDNTYLGHRLAIWILIPVMLLKAIQGVASIVDTRNVVIAADGIPLDTFNAASAQAVIALFTLIGLYGLVLPVQSAVVVIRYRAMIPFMYLLFLLVQFSSRAVILVRPIVRSDGHAIGFYVNLGILALTLLGFVLSLLHTRIAPKTTEESTAASVER